MIADNLIIITGGSYNDIKKSLRQWIELYSDDLENDAYFELYNNVKGKHVIKADKRIDNERFNYLVNYLMYPEGIDYKIEIQGYTTAFDIETFPNELLNQKLLIYISDIDKEYDNVFAITENNEVFKIDFGGRITKVNEYKTFKPPDLNFDHLINPEIIKLNKKEVSKIREEGSKDNLQKRFKIISLIALGLTLLSFLVLFIDKRIFFKVVFFLELGLGTWYFSDYKMLQIDKYYFYCLFISIGFLCYGLIIKNQYAINTNELINLGLCYPISLLIVQKPFRFIFKLVFKREPIINKPPPTFWDGVYTFLLFLTFVVLPFIIIDIIK